MNKLNPMISKCFFMTCVLLLLTACEEQVRMPEPQDEAALFFDALFNEQDLERATRYATAEYGEVLLHYGTSRAASRYLYGITLDSAEINADRGGVRLYRDRSDMALVQVSLTGRFHGRQYDHALDVIMRREGRQWLVERVVDGRFTPVEP